MTRRCGHGWTAIRRLLNPEEVTREARFHFEADKERFVIGRTLARLQLSRFLGGDPRQWQFVTNEHGRPELVAPPGPRTVGFNVSHTHGLIACAITVDRGRGRGRRVRRPDAHPRRRRALLLAARGGRPARAAARRTEARVLRLLDAERGVHQGARPGAGAAARATSRSCCAPPRAPSIAFSPDLHDDRTTWQFAQFWPTARASDGGGRSARTGTRRRRAHREHGARGARREALGDQRPARRLTTRIGRAVEALEAHPDDWLIVAGDTGDTPAHLDFVLRTLTPRFAQLIWVPGNHDLWTPRALAADQRGVAHYERLVELCRSYGVLTPEDPYAVWPGDGPRAPSSRCSCSTTTRSRRTTWRRTSAVAGRRSRECARRTRTCWRPHPYRQPSRRGVTQRVAEARGPARQRSRRMSGSCSSITGRCAAISRCCRAFRGSRSGAARARTDDWHRQFNVETVVYGHLHLRSSRAIDDVRFDEVSLGYPKQWDQRPRA